MKFLKKFNEDIQYKSDEGWCGDDTIKYDSDFKEVLSELKRMMIFDEEEGWKPGKLNDLPNCILNYYYDLNDKFKVCIIARITSEFMPTPIVYLYNVEEDMYDYLGDVTIKHNDYLNVYLGYGRNKYTEYAVKIGNKALIYYNKLDEMPSQEDLRLSLIDIEDEYSLIKVKSGFFIKKYPGDTSKLVNSYSSTDPGHKIFFGYIFQYNISSDIKSSFSFGITKDKYKDIELNLEDKFDHVKGRLEFYDDELNLDYKILDNILFIMITK